MLKKTANIKVDAAIHAEFKDALDDERFIGRTLDKLMRWYINASQAQRESVLNGSQPSTVNEKKVKYMSQALFDMEERMHEIERILWEMRPKHESKKNKDEG